MRSSIITYISIICLIILTDFYVFPIGIQNMPGVNTKMLMAAIGVIYLLFNPKNLVVDFINRQFVGLTIWAIGFSLICLMSVILNSTSDFTYANYVVSMWVWLFAAFLLINLIQAVHGHVSIQILTNYVLSVAVIQCLCTLLLEYNVNFLDFVKKHQLGFILLFETEGRLQGIGAALDPAGIRFAAILVMTGYVAVNHKNWNWFIGMVYLSAFIFITMVGNMIARTTTVGTLIAIIYWFGSMIFGKSNQKREVINIFKSLIILQVILLPIVSFYYNVNPHFRENLRFGFEGFFSLIEKGKWEVSSNDILKSMIKFPELLKTWIIGDGYIENPSNGGDPYYVGNHYKGYYMNTDIGYLRFVFYCGIMGLFTFIAFFVYAAQCAIDRIPKDKVLPILLLLLNFVIWIKVSTDIFQFFALLLCLPKLCELENNEAIASAV